MSTKTEFYDRLKIQLQDSQQWPGRYMFKFIVKQPSSKAAVQALFSEQEVDYAEKASKKGTYTSLTFQTEMQSPEAVIAIYKKADTIEGILML